MKKYLALASSLSVVLAVGCGDDGGGSSNAGTGAAGMTTAGTAAGTTAGTIAGTTAGTDSGGTGAGTGGGDTPECVNQDDINFDCPFNLPPITGTCAPAGTCCHRASNIAKVAMLGPDEPAQIEFRLNYVEVYNHPDSVGLPDLVRTANQRAQVCSGEQCLLWRFTAPRQGGQFVAGMGEVEIGIGAYNCDGTFSFYGPNAAPDRNAEIGETDPGRWQSVKVAAEVDPSQTGRDRYHIPWAMNENRKIARSIFLNPADNSIDWELASSGFDIVDIDWSGDVLDCIGSLQGVDVWGTVGTFEAYSPLLGNEKDVSIQTNQTYCSLLAFGLLPEGMKDKDCIGTARCMPDGGEYGDGGCDWVKLPDALCPVSDEERALFGCHLGAEGNPNMEEGYPADLGCTAEAPTTAQNPDMGVTTKGQCCDPMGQSGTLPACNAYRTLGKFVAAASEITDAPRNDVPPMCE